MNTYGPLADSVGCFIVVFCPLVPTILVLFCRIISASPNVGCGSLHLLQSVSGCSCSDDDYAKLWSMSLAEYHYINFFLFFLFFCQLCLIGSLSSALSRFWFLTFQQIVSHMGFLSLYRSQLKPVIGSPTSNRMVNNNLLPHPCSQDFKWVTFIF